IPSCEDKEIKGSPPPAKTSSSFEDDASSPTLSQNLDEVNFYYEDHYEEKIAGLSFERTGDVLNEARSMVQIEIGPILPPCVRSANAIAPSPPARSATVQISGTSPPSGCC